MDLLIIISGAKNSKKNLLAMDLASNSDCRWIKPYTDREVPVNQENWEMDEYVHLTSDLLDKKIVDETVMASIIVDGDRWVFFESQFDSAFGVIIGDDSVVSQFRENWNGELFTIKCHSKDEKYSERSLLKDSEFDAVFCYGRDDYDDLEAKIVYR